VLFAVALAFYVLSPLGRHYGDGPIFLSLAAHGETSHHMAFGVVLRVRELLGLPADGYLHAVSALGGALAVGLLAGALRRTWVAIAAGLTPVLWFFSTVIEVHSLQAAACVGVVLGARALARSTSPRRWLALAALMLVLPVFHPLTAVLWPALLLAQLRTQKARLRFATLAALVVIGFPLLLSALSAPLAELLANQESTLGSMAFGLVTHISNYGLPGPVDFANYTWNQIALTFGPLLALTAIELGLRIFRGARTAPGLGLEAGLALFSSIVVLELVGVRELGGYSISLLPYVVLTAGALVERLEKRWAQLLLVVLVASQGLAGHQMRAEYAGEMDDSTWGKSYSEQLAQHNVAAKDTIVLTVRYSRVFLLESEQGVLSWDLRYAFDAVPRRDRAVFLEKLMGQIQGYLNLGRILVIDKALLEDHVGCANVADLRVRLRETYDLTPLGELGFVVSEHGSPPPWTADPL
jgi:hypothetical protein